MWDVLGVIAHYGFHREEDSQTAGLTCVCYLAGTLQDSLKSKIADTKNTGKRAGGAISAALFLKEFVKEAQWAHIAMAG